MEKIVKSKTGKALADALCKDTTVADALRSNELGVGGGKALADAIRKNTALTSLEPEKIVLAIFIVDLK